jgi:hypothetical protein
VFGDILLEVEGMGSMGQHNWVLARWEAIGLIYLQKYQFIYEQFHTWQHIFHFLFVSVRSSRKKDNNIKQQCEGIELEFLGRDALTALFSDKGNLKCKPTVFVLCVEISYDSVQAQQALLLASE